MKPLHKRVPHDMAPEYLERGWTIWKREERTVLLIWNQAGAPP